MQHARARNRQPASSIVCGRWGKDGVIMRRHEDRDEKRCCEERPFLFYCCNMGCLLELTCLIDSDMDMMEQRALPTEIKSRLEQ